MLPQARAGALCPIRTAYRGTLSYAFTTTITTTTLESTPSLFCVKGVPGPTVHIQIAICASDMSHDYSLSMYIILASISSTDLAQQAVLIPSNHLLSSITHSDTLLIDCSAFIRSTCPNYIETFSFTLPLTLSFTLNMHLIFRTSIYPTSSVRTFSVNSKFP